MPICFDVSTDDKSKDDKNNDDKNKMLEVEKNLFAARTIFVSGRIEQSVARDVCANLLALAHVSSSSILMVVSSPGGHVESGDMIHDVVRFIEPKVVMLGTGWVASAGALIYVSVPKERRFATPNTRFLLHQPSGGTGGPASDIEIQAREIIRMRTRLDKIFSNATGQTTEQIEADTDRDHWMNAEEAVEYGLCGRIISSRSEIQ